MTFALAAVLLAGCQSNPEPPPFESASDAATPTATASPADAAPTLPPEAKGTSEASAKAFVRHYFDTLNYAMNSGQTKHLRSLATRECESCGAISNNIDRTYEVGGHIKSRGWLLQSIALVPRQSSERPILDLGVLMTAEEVTSESGAEPELFTGGRQPMTIYLVRLGGQWRVARLDRVA
ncbi:MAG TPA: DUF6318 family protein [Nocardioidaceae bacterium]|nr:DUF6318 family protein [Nocardioidaceae bacterium]